MAGLPVSIARVPRWTRVKAALTPQEWRRAGLLVAAIAGLHIVGFFLLFAVVAPHHYSLGASAIYAVSRNFNLMLESVATWDEEVNDAGRTERNVSVIISPGVRYAFNHPNDAQTVIGIAAPIGVTAAAPDFGVFLYASFEHFFFRPKAKGGEK